MQLAGQGVEATIFEMKPEKYSPAHQSPALGELVCSNSLRSQEKVTGVGLLKEEMQKLGSLIMKAAQECRVPAGKALAVDRERFADYLTRSMQEHELIRVVRKEIQDLDDPVLQKFDAVIIAAGPLVSDPLAESLFRIIGDQDLYFYDAIAPIVSADSIDYNKAFWGSRYNPEDDSYLNCPMNQDEYYRFYRELINAEKVPARDFEEEKHFQGCMPIEAMAEKGELTMAFGPLKPVGLVDPRTNEQPFAVVQLRAENLEKTAFNLVGFQTRLKLGEQKRVFTMIPGLENAEFLRLGSMHRNTFVNAPQVLTPDLELRVRSGIYLAGQISGVEGYVESAASGLWLGLKLGLEARGKKPAFPPRETALGALVSHLQSDAKNFQPSNIHFGLFPSLKVKAKKSRRKELYAQRAEESFEHWLTELDKN